MERAMICLCPVIFLSVREVHTIRNPDRVIYAFQGLGKHYMYMHTSASHPEYSSTSLFLLVWYP